MTRKKPLPSLKPLTPERQEAAKMEAAPIPVTLELNEKMLHDNITSGIEYGVQYWAAVDVGEHQVGWRNYFTARFTVTESGDEVAVLGQTYELSIEKLVAGLLVLSKKYKHHFSDILGEDGDATTGDVLIQCALFGDIIFG